MNYHGSLLNTKIKTASWFLTVAFVVIAGRLFQLQIIQQHNFYTKSQKNFLRIETIPPIRGTILDRNNQLLATNRPTTNIFWEGTGNTKFSEDQLKNLQLLETILGKSITSDEHTFENLKCAERRYQKVLLASDIPFEQLSQIAEQISQQKNIAITTHFKRYYPYKSFASHLLGYLNRIDLEMYGKMGLEKLFEDTLKGERGQKQKTINSFGRNLSETEVKKAEAGKNIQTTLDISFQEIVERIFPEDFVGTFIVMDPHDGDILALLSRPNFDPAVFLDPMHDEDWRLLQEKQPFLNRAFNACYPPGSIFKLVSISAMLEQKLITPDSCWNCQGYVEFANRHYHCNNRTGHGVLNVEQSLAFSCNILFYEIGKKIGIDLLADYAHRFGLGEKTNIMFAEKEGLIPTAAWKKRVKNERWWPGDTLSVVIGQSYLLVTPIQIGRMISSIFTGSLVTPRVLMNEPITKTPVNISLETRKFLQQSMLRAVKEGTGRGVKYVKDIKVYAKTSTAQTSSWEKREQGTEYLEHAWFVSYVTYKDEKPLTLVILIEHAGTSRVPTGIAAEFLREYKRMIDVRNIA